MNTPCYDEIKIKNLEVFANHGVFPEETGLVRNLSSPLLCIRTQEKPA